MNIPYHTSDSRLAGSGAEQGRASGKAAAVAADQVADRVHGAALLTVLLALVAAMVLAGCGNESNDAQGAAAAQEGRSVRVETMVLQPTTFEDVIEITGAVEALDDATLSAQTAGTVIALAPLGSQVGAGQSVAQLDPALGRSGVEQAQARVESAQAQFDLAQDNLKRNEPLYSDSVISAVEWENVRAQFNQARADLSQAQAALSQAQEQLRQSRVTSPFAGTVESHFAEIGEQLSPGQQVARVINTQRVKVVAGVPERFSADIAPGTEVSVDFRAYAGTRVDSEVNFVGRAIDPQSRTFPVEILLPNPSGTYKPEMVAQVYVTRERMEDALVVPRAAIVRDEDGTSVFLAEEEGDQTIAVKTPVVLGSGYGGSVVVTNLQEGDEVVVLGQTNLTEGDRLQVMERYESVDDAPNAATPETEEQTVTPRPSE